MSTREQTLMEQAEATGDPMVIDPETGGVVDISMPPSYAECARCGRPVWSVDYMPVVCDECVALLASAGEPEPEQEWHDKAYGDYCREEYARYLAGED